MKKDSPEEAFARGQMLMRGRMAVMVEETFMLGWNEASQWHNLKPEPYISPEAWDHKTNGCDDARCAVIGCSNGPKVGRFAPKEIRR